MAAPVMQDATPIVLLNNVTVTATGNSIAFSLPEAEAYALVLNVTASSGTTPVDNIVLQHAMDGTIGNPGNSANPQVAPTVWVNTGMAFASTAGVGTQTLLFKPTVALADAASVVSVTPGTASAKNQPIRRTFCRLSHTITGTTPSITFTLYALAVPKGFSVV